MLIQVARKPPDSQQSALCIDACRITGVGTVALKPYLRSTPAQRVLGLGMNYIGAPVSYQEHPQGRWPTNTILCGGESLIAKFSYTAGAGNKVPQRAPEGMFGMGDRLVCRNTHGDTGGSGSRFFWRVVDPP